MSTSNIVPMRANLQRLRKYLKSVADGIEIQLDYIPKANRLIGGFERKKLVIIGSRPSEGKSAFALQMAYEVSRNFKVLYLSLEMTVEEAMFRMFCYEQKITNTDFYNGKYYDFDNVFNKFKESLEKNERLLIVGEEIGRTWEEIESIFDSLGEDAPDIIILDYVQCITTGRNKIEAVEDYIKKFR